MSQAHRIAFIGLGRMGMPFARNLLAAGFSVVGYDAAEPARVAFASLAQAAETAADAVQDADVLITMLPDGRAVRAVVSEVLDRMRPGTTVIDMSSSDPVGSRGLGQMLEDRGHTLIDAPVSGGVARAETGSVAIMAGGRADAIDRMMPIFDVLGSRVFRTGALGSGHAVKALNNYVSAAGLQAACEALLVAQAFGITGETLIDVLNASTGRNNSTEVKMKPFVLSESFASGFALGLMSKDVGTARDLAGALGVTAPGLSAAADFWARGAGMLPGGDHTEIHRVLQSLQKGTPD